MSEAINEFWSVDHPVDADVWDGVIIEADASLPGVVCSSCGETWSGCNILPFGLNQEARRVIGSRGRCIDMQAFIELRSRLSSVLGLSPMEVHMLSPGAASAPFTIKSRYALPPMYSGEQTVVTHAFVASLSTIEREQIDVIPAVSSAEYDAGGCLIRAKLESDLPTGLIELSRCEACGFVAYRRQAPSIRYTPASFMRLLAANPRLDFFTLKPTAMLAISSRIKEKIEVLGSKQIEFRRIDELDLKDLAAE